jgi:phosphate transport system permease protein
MGQIRKVNYHRLKIFFDQKITNWKELGKDEPIVLFRTGDITDYYTEEELGENFVNFPDKINDLMAKTPGIIFLG